MAGKGKGGRRKSKGKSTSRSAKAGLQFPVGRIARYMRAMNLADRLGSGAGNGIGIAGSRDGGGGECGVAVGHDHDICISCIGNVTMMELDTYVDEKGKAKADENRKEKGNGGGGGGGEGGGRSTAYDIFVADDRYWLLRSTIVAVITAIFLESVFYGAGGCEEADEAREDYDHQVSNQMCCLAEWLIAAIGFTGAGVLSLFGVPRIYRDTGDAMGVVQCPARCFSEPAKRLTRTLAVLLALEGVGLIVVAIFQMCWQVELHTIGVFLFFVPGTIHVILLTLSIDRQADETTIVLLECSPALLEIVAVVLRIFTGNYYAEWALIFSIGLAILVTQWRVVSRTRELGIAGGIRGVGVGDAAP